MNPPIYSFVEGATPYLASWLCLFTLVTAWRLARKLRSGEDRVPDSVFFTELPGLPIAALQSVCFVWALATRDWLSALLFAPRPLTSFNLAPD